MLGLMLASCLLGEWGSATLRNLAAGPREHPPAGDRRAASPSCGTANSRGHHAAAEVESESGSLGAGPGGRGQSAVSLRWWWASRALARRALDCVGARSGLTTTIDGTALAFCHRGLGVVSRRAMLWPGTGRLLPRARRILCARLRDRRTGDRPGPQRLRHPAEGRRRSRSTAPSAVLNVAGLFRRRQFVWCEKTPIPAFGAKGRAPARRTICPTGPDKQSHTTASIANARESNGCVP
jgi:hypothetical protein